MMLTPDLSRKIAAALRGLEYGCVQLVIHDAQLVRIERVERTRLTVFAEASTTSPGQPTGPTEACHDEQE